MSTRRDLRLNAQTYQANHDMQEKGASLIMQQFKSKINWKNGNQLLDIGCGPGDITVNYLLHSAPKDAEMTGIDISPAMLELAKEAFTDHRLKFICGDIEDPNFGADFKESFDIGFSFYCLHWIQNQRLAIRNIYDVLKPGGETLFSIVVSSLSYKLEEIMARKNKWSPYMQDQPEFVSPYYRAANPVHKVKTLLLDLGFEILDCYLSSELYALPSREALYETVQAVNPYLSRIPEALHEEYHAECKTELFSNSTLLARSEKTGEVETSYKYTQLIVFARKPHTNNHR